MKSVRADSGLSRTLFKLVDHVFVAHEPEHALNGFHQIIPANRRGISLRSFRMEFHFKGQWTRFSFVFNNRIAVWSVVFALRQARMKVINWISQQLLVGYKLGREIIPPNPFAHLKRQNQCVVIVACRSKTLILDWP